MDSLAIQLEYTRNALDATNLMCKQKDDRIVILEYELRVAKEIIDYHRSKGRA